MKDVPYIDRKERRVFETRIRGIKSQDLAPILDGKNAVGWWRSLQIRFAWRKLLGKFKPEFHESVRNQYCG